MVPRAPLLADASAWIAMASWAAITSGVPDILLHHDVLPSKICHALSPMENVSGTNTLTNLL